MAALLQTRPSDSPSNGLNRLSTWATLITVATGMPGLAATHVLGGHSFTLPDGFTIEIAAGNDLVPRPVSAGFDKSGALYVTDSSGSNKPPAEQLKDPQGRILRLEDLDGDGRFDKSTVYADKVMFPQGCLWHDGSVYVAGPPSIWKFTDTDGDGKADQRTEWYKGNILTGCANDVHGPYLGPEAMIYWTKGAFGRLDLKDGKGRPLRDRCAHIFRAWPDGTGLESVMSGGMDNPVEVAFTSNGEPIVISTFIDLSQPGRRDGLGHAVYGGVFGKINDVVDEPMVRRTGALLPTMTHFGPAAACALTRYQGSAWGSAYRDNLFSTLFNLRKVMRHVVQPAGATLATADSDFVVSDQPDFHPTDVLQDADGSLLIVDTGGWYKLCCPSSQLAKADVLGGIYRVRKTGSARLTPDARPAAYSLLVQPPKLDDASELTKLKRASLAAKAESAAHLRDVLNQEAAKASTSTDAAQKTRVAAEGLGRIGDRASVPSLFNALAATSVNEGAADRFLEHSLIFALIEIGDVDAARTQLSSGNSAIRRAALLVLEQAGDSTALQVADISPALGGPAGPVRDTALWVARRHPEWGGQLASVFREKLKSPATPNGERAGWESMLDLLARQGESQAFLAETLNTAGYRDETRIAALGAMSGSGVKQLPTGWREAVHSGLKTPASSANRTVLVSAALRSLRSLPFPKSGDDEITSTLRSLAVDTSLPPALRLDTLAGLPAGATVSDTEFSLLVGALAPGNPAAERLSAASALQHLKLQPGQRALLIPSVATAGPVELPRLISAFSGGGDATLGARFVASLNESKAIRSLRPEDIKQATAGFPVEIQAAALTAVASAQSDASQNSLRLDALLVELQKLNGQIRRGQAIFNSPKAACSSCHRLGYLGGDIGPDLTAIGTSRTERDLLEAVVYPSSSFVRSYEPWIASTKDGEEYGGVLRRDTPEEIVLATGPGAEVRVARARLADLRPGQLSVMPAGLDEQLSKQELADLLAFLKNTKWGVN